MLQLAHMGSCVLSLSLSASLLGMQFGSHSLAPGQRGPCESLNSWAALGARKAEVTRPFRTGDHKAPIEEGPLVSTSGQGWLLSDPILGRFCAAFSSPFLGCSDEAIGRPIYRYSLRKSLIQKNHKRQGARMGLRHTQRKNGLIEL